jgi:hypothetical protein
MRAWLLVAIKPPVMRRAFKYALIVGAVLILINHGDALLNRDITMARLLKMLLTVMVPYSVSTASSVAALREVRGAR